MTGQKRLMINRDEVETPVVLSHALERKLTLPQLIAVARGDGRGNIAEVTIDPESLERCRRSAAYIEKAVIHAEKLALNIKPDEEMDYRDLIYGVNTGFGNNRDKPIKSYLDACRLSENILLSHRVGVGPPLPSEIVRATMLLRLRAFVEGRSGIRVELLLLLCDMLNGKVHPYVPSQGSLGSSGDLCQLAHLGIVLIGGGKAWHEPDFPATGEKRGEPIPGLKALQSAGLEIPPVPERLAVSGENGIHLAPKEGLALTNGAAVSAAITALCAYDAGTLLHTANLNGALSLQAVGGFSRAYDPRVHDARPYKGQKETAAEVRNFLKGSSFVDQAARGHHQQDEYSLRAVPQVHGAVSNAVSHVSKLIEIEINSATDNPLIFAEPEDQAVSNDTGAKTSRWEAYSAANFHGEPVGMAADYLKIAVSELGNISERRVQLLLDPVHNRGLPANLSGSEEGLDSGFMLFQYTSASLVSENKVLCHPSSTDSIPTSANVEDHNAMSGIAANNLRQVITNTVKILAAELITSLQALDFRLSGDCPITSHLGEPLDGDFALSGPTGEVHRLIRNGSGGLRGVPFIAEDSEFRENQPGRLIEDVAESILRSEVLHAAYKHLDNS